MVKRASNIVLMLLFISILAYGENPLRGYVNEESFRSGEKIFQSERNDIFQEAAAMNRANSEAQLRGRFPEVISVVNREGIWHGTFYFNNGEGKKLRKTIKGSGVVKGVEDTFAVTIFSEGIRVRDIVSGITTEIKTKRR